MTGRAKTRPLPLLTSLGGALLYCLFATMQWRRFDSPSWDLGIFTQVAQDYSQLRAPLVAIKGVDFNILGDHFSPILVLLGPVYRVFPSPLALLLVQAALFAASIYVVTALAARLLPPLVATTIGVAYALSFGLQGALGAQFHEIAFAVPLLALSLAAYISGRFRSAALYALPLLFVKEDLGLTIAAIGVVLLLKRAYRWGSILIVAGLAGFAIITTVVIPLFSSEHDWQYVSTIPLGEYWSHPWTLLTSLFEAHKLQTMGLLLATTGLVGVRSPIFLVAIPTLLWRFYSKNTGYYGFDWHYNAVLMPVVVLALIDVISRRTPSGAYRWKLLLRAAPVAALTVSLTMTPQLSLGRLLDPGFSARTPRIESAARAVALLKPGGVAVSDVGLIAYVAAKEDTYYAGTTGIAPPDYYVIDAVAAGWSDPPRDLAQYAESQHHGHRYSNIFDENGYEVAALQS